MMAKCRVERLEVMNADQRRTGRRMRNARSSWTLAVAAPGWRDGRRLGVSRSMLLDGVVRREPKHAAYQTGFVPAIVVAESRPTLGPVEPARGGAFEIEFVAAVPQPLSSPASRT